MASSKGGQQFIGKNRAPRVQVEYDVELYGAEKKVNLPFVMGVLSDLSGTPAAPPLPQEAGAANAVDRYDPTRENAMPERPQTLRLCSIKNILSAIYAQSNAERI